MCDVDGDRIPCSNSGWLPSCVALGKLLNLSGLRVSYQQIAGNKGEYFLDTHFTGCADQIKLCMWSNWKVPGTGKDWDSRRVFYHYYDGGAKQTGMLSLYPVSMSTNICGVTPTYVTLCCTLGTEQQTKMPFLANQSLKCTWILGVGRAVLQTQRWEWPHLFNYQVAVWLRYPSSGLGATLLQRKAQKRKKRKQIVPETERIMYSHKVITGPGRVVLLPFPCIAVVIFTTLWLGTHSGESTETPPLQQSEMYRISK